MKNTITKFAAILLLLSVSLSSCSESDSESADFDFVGEDNYITKLAISVGSTTYNASIADDEVTLIVPTDLSFTGATVDYTITEKATISPDPTTKSDWGTEELFVVTSYNDARRSYTYRVVRSDIEAVGNIILNTQSELDAFAAQGNSNINGNLTIGKTESEDDPITSLASLSTIKTIAYDLTIGTGYLGENLEGLNNLETVGGISIDDTEELTSIYLPSLTNVGTTLNLLADNLASLTMDNLTSIGENFTVKTNMLESSSFAKLAYVGGTMTFNGGSSTTANSPLERVQFPALTSIDGDMYLGYWSKAYVFEMPKLEEIGGCATLLSWSSIEDIELPLLSSAGGFVFQTITSSLEVSLPELTSISDKLTLYAAGMTSFSTPKLESVGGVLYIYSTCTKLTNLDFSKLSHIYQLNIRSTIMTGLSDFPALTTVDDILYLYSCTAFDGDLDVSGISIGTLYLYGSTLTNMSSIIGDEDFDGQLSIYTPVSGVTELPSITGIESIKSLYISTGSYYYGTIDLGSIKTIKELATFQSCTNATEISCPSLTSAGSIKFLYCNNLQTADFPLLETITGYGEGDSATAGDFNYTVSSDLKEISLPELVSVDGAFTVSSIDSDATMTQIGVAKLATIGGALTMSGSNAYFNDLSTFSTLTSVGSVSISTLTTLADFTGLSGVIPTLSSSSWSVSGCSYNPSYQNMVDGEYTNQ